MFKFFRKYNQRLLAVGVCALMVVFLIQGAMSGGPKPGDEAIGTLNGRNVTGHDMQQAQGQISLLAAINGNLPYLASPDPLTWLLEVEEAKQAGVSASELEVDLLFKAVGLDDDTKLMEQVRKAGQTSATLDMIRDTAREWIAVQNYRELAMGRSHSTIENKFRAVQIAGFMGQMPQYRDIISEMIRGQARLSQPVLARYLQDEQSNVRITAVKIGAESYAAKSGAPTPKLIADLYNEFKDVLPRKPGAPEPAREKDSKTPANPHGFGYRIPQTAKFEYLAFPLARITATIQVEEADLLSYYDQHKNEFVPAPPASADPKAPKPELPPKPYGAVRKQIETKLRGQRAWELGEKMVAAAITQLSTPLKDVTEEGGYKILPGDLKSPPLSAVAEAIQKQFGILPDVQRMEDRWLDEDMVEKLPGLGEAQLLSGQGTAADYLFSAREFWAKPGDKPDVKNAPTDPMRRLHLQVGVPSAAVVAGEGDRYIFRVTAVQVSRPPIALDEVRAQVTADATRLQAYRVLQADSDVLVKRFVDEGPSVIAKAFNTERLAPPAFPRRQNDPQSGEPVVPYVLGIGRDEHFVDALFDLVNKAGGPAINNLPAEKRVGSVLLDSEFSLVIVRVEEFTPLTRSQFEAQSRGGFLAARANAQLLSGSELNSDPFSVEALSKRVNYVPRRGRDEAKDGDKPKDDKSDAGDKPATTQKG